MIRGAMASFAVASAFWAAPAQALQIFTDRADWEAALAGASITSDPFENPIADGSTITFDSGVVSTGTPASSFIRNVVSSSGWYEGSVDGGESDIAFDTITWTFPIPIIGFGLDLENAGANDPLTITGNFDGTDDQLIRVLEILGLQSGFLGVIGTASFSSILLNDEDLSSVTNSYFLADNLSFAAPAAAAVPEPATLALFGAGLAGLGWAARRRKVA